MDEHFKRALDEEIKHSNQGIRKYQVKQGTEVLF